MWSTARRVGKNSSRAAVDQSGRLPRSIEAADGSGRRERSTGAAEWAGRVGAGILDWSLGTRPAQGAPGWSDGFRKHFSSIRTKTELGCHWSKPRTAKRAGQRAANKIDEINRDVETTVMLPIADGDPELPPGAVPSNSPRPSAVRLSAGLSCGASSQLAKSSLSSTLSGVWPFSWHRQSCLC
jgi:hypothetical protein